MSDEETRNKRQQRRKKNNYAKVLRQTTQFLPKVKDSDKNYKRIRINPREIKIDDGDD